MVRPTISSSGPDAMGRTFCHTDESSRRARYGRIQPMHSHGPLRRVIERLLAR
ncbi:hypothetical protein [Erythrobacter sp. JK5]|uniref:hypothetical protein n=1 Tax=Erythrobacter sp. JK5 TaxID=2829500 RepID=UPI001BAE051C|nr:hypothetical protein [Erythrobacter sp. JK5]QUL38180.1 hypothetical protein KDC96_01790 [Erythrobacter sp. JK5]